MKPAIDQHNRLQFVLKANTFDQVVRAADRPGKTLGYGL
jgi:hypothetical protein